MGETPGKRVRGKKRGRNRARRWHTRVTARLRQGGQRYRQGRLREGEREERRAREGAQGCETAVVRRRAGGTRRARGSSGEREHGDTKKNSNRTGGHPERTRRGGRAREVGGTGGQQGRKGTQCLSQRKTMPKTVIEPYRPLRPMIREVMEGLPAGEDDGGVPSKGVSGEAAQVGLQVGRQGGGPEARESARDTTMARGRPAASTRSRRTTPRGRAGNRGEGRVERRERRLTSSKA